MTERTIVADEVTCPKCYSKAIATTGSHKCQDYPTMYTARCSKGHKFAYLRTVKVISWASESTEVQSD